MGLLGKRSSAADIDYTLLQKRGIIKKSEVASVPDVVDFTSSTGSSNSSSTDSGNVNSGMAPNMFGFLDSAPSATSSISSSPSVASSVPDLNALKIRIEDIEYKLDRFLESVSKIEQKMSEIERKTER